MEELGYILQPHTSAGRIPSDKGYRFYVDQIIKEKDSQVEHMQELMIQRVDRVELLLKQLAKVLAKNTNYATLISGPSYSQTKLNFIQPQHPQALSYAVVQSDPVEGQEPKKTMSDWLEAATDWVTEFLIMFFTGSGLVFWLVILVLVS